MCTDGVFRAVDINSNRSCASSDIMRTDGVFRAENINSNRLIGATLAVISCGPLDSEEQADYLTILTLLRVPTSFERF
jgi:hypothetical protein